MNRAPAFQFYAKDWLSSARITLMSSSEEGAYIRLLAHCWDSEDCTLPDDDEQLAVLSRLGQQWLSYAPGSNPVRSCFEAHPSRPRRLFNKRLYEEWKKLRAFQKERAESGRKGADSRWKPRKSRDGSAIAQPTAQPMAEGMAKNGSSSSFSSSSSKEDPPTPRRESEELTPECIQADWNKISGVKTCKALGKTIKDRIRTRLREYPNQTWWTHLFAQVSASDFLCGRTTGKDGPFHASLDWMLSPKNLDKILAGNYDPTNSNGHDPSPTCTKRIYPAGSQVLRECREPASPLSRPNEPRCPAHLRHVEKSQEVTRER